METSKTLSAKIPRRLRAALDGGGSMGELIRSYDWASTEVGRMEEWPTDLVTTLSLVLSSSFPMILFWGPSLLTFYNDAHIPLFGRRHPLGLGKPAKIAWGEVWDVIHPMLQQALNGKATMSNDQLLVMTRNGYAEECYFTWSYSPVRNDDGAVVGILSPITETTLRVFHERRMSLLRDVSSKTLDVRTVTEACDVVSNVLCTQPSLITFSLLYTADPVTGALRLQGASGFTDPAIPAPPHADDLTKKRHVPHGAASPKLLAYLHDFLIHSSGNPKNIESSLVTPYLGELPCSSCGLPTTHVKLKPFQPKRAGNAPMHLLVLGLNSGRELDDDYRGFLSLLSYQVARAFHTASDYEDEKLRAEQLVELDRVKTVFFSNISHEFRTPLTLVIGPLEDALSNTQALLPEVHRKRLQLVHHNSLRLLKHVNSLLDFSRIQANRIQAAFEPTDLGALTSNLAGVFRSLIERAGLKLQVEVAAGENLTVFVDREMYEKIIFNLLSNAFKFTFDGGIWVLVRAHPSDKNRVELLVRDTGVGIPAAELPNIFERFHRITSSKGRSFEGTGIGLALTYELVKAHHGTIEVESTKGQGTTCTLTFLRGSGHLPPQHVRHRESYCVGDIGHGFVEEASHWLPTAPAIIRSPPLSTPSALITPPSEISSEVCSRPSSVMTTPLSIQPTRVLVVDDNHEMRTYLQSALSSSVEIVETAVDGADALRIALKQPPHLIISDVMMPVMDGVQLIAHLKSHASTRHIPVILLSARADEEARLEGLQAKAEDYIVKPFSAKELVARVHTHLELGALRRQLETQVEQRTQELQHANEALTHESSERIRTETELVQQRTRTKLSEEYKEKLEQFIDNLCHEIRNPLNGAFGTVMVMRDRMDELARDIDKLPAGVSKPNLVRLIQDLNQDLGVLNHCSHQQKVILDDALDFSRLSNGKVELNPLPCSIESLIDNAVKCFTSLIQQKHLVVETHCTPADLWCRLDAHRVSQVLINLVSNAIKFTDKGSITVRANFELTSGSNSTNMGSLTFSVRDTGVGMTSEEMERLFDRFSQANARISSGYGGSGLGLSVSKQLALLMRGDLQAESKKGHGSAFTFFLPCERVAAVQQQGVLPLQPPPLYKSHQQEATYLDRNVNVLIVEDNAINQKLLMNLLARKSYLYEVANNGQEAVEKFSRSHFDLIFMDLQMPIMDGIAATQQIRKLEAMRREAAPTTATQRPVPIFALTGNAREARVQEALSAGMNGYLTKPYDWQHIYDVIRQSVLDPPGGNVPQS